MRKYKFIYAIIISGFVLFTSCSTLEQASVHGFNSGYYKYDSDKKTEMVYLDITEDKIDLYSQRNKIVDKDLYLSIPVKYPDSLQLGSYKFRKQSLDIDITTILLKYRPSVYGIPDQLTTDLNVSLYAGWRFDKHKIIVKTDPLGKRFLKFSDMGYDFGVFAGPGATQITPSTTRNLVPDEYSGMILQTGVAGFLETNVASFGIALGFDYLLNDDRRVWIYDNKLWVGFVVGVALN